MILQGPRCFLTLTCALGVGLVLAGLQGPWIKFPLSPPLFIDDFVLPIAGFQLNSLKSFIGILLLIIVGAWLFGYRLVSALASLAVLALFTCFVVYAWGNHHWLVVYITESEQRDFLQTILSRYYWPNLNPEPATILLPQFEYLSDRVILFWHMTGWGWVWVLSGIVLLLMNSFYSRVSVLTTLLSMVILLFFMITMSSALMAERNQRHGDEMLSSGYPEKAIFAYERALLSSPELHHSRPFAMKSSHAYYLLEGEESPFAYLYILGGREASFARKYAKNMDGEALKLAQLSLPALLETPSEGDALNPLQHAIISQSIIEINRNLITQGFNDYENGALSSSLLAFQQALKNDPNQIHAQFFVAHIFKELGLFDNAIETLQRTLPSIANSPLRADLLCTIGEAYEDAGQPLLARKAYGECLDSDSLFNYRAVRNLAGS